MNLVFEKFFIGLFGFLLCFLEDNEFRVDAIRTDDKLQLIFRQRSKSDWNDVWHSESHFRCREDLVTQLYWACKNDIYGYHNLAKKGSKTNRLTMANWLRPEFAQSLLRTVRSHRSSITNECCIKGCTWEEYAEYCPYNKRRYHLSPAEKSKDCA